MIKFNNGLIDSLSITVSTISEKTYRDFFFSKQRGDHLPSAKKRIFSYSKFIY